MFYSRLIASFVVCLASSAASAQDKPDVLIIGDSISIGYMKPTTDLLKDVANVKHNAGNAQHTRTGLEKIDSWLGDTKWKVIHFNWGLWDLVEGGTAVPIKEYGENMEKLVERLKKTGAVLIFATTTPVPDVNGRKRKDSDVQAYNKVAVEIMKKHNVIVDDLYAATKPNLATWQKKDDVHFQPAGSAGLAKEVAESIRKTLGK